MKHRLACVGLFAVLGIVLVSCSDGDSIDSTRPASTDVINREVILNNLDDVRAIIADSAEDLDPASLADVEYTDGQLRIVLAQAADLTSLGSMCDEIGRAIALPDLRIAVESSDGAERTECDFDG